MASCGKNWARATPICAFAAMRVASACWMSGRRSRSCEGRPVGMSCGGGGQGVRRSAGDGSGVFAEQDPDGVLLLLDLLLKLRDLRGGRVEKLLGLADVGEGCGTAGLECFGQVDGVLADFEGLLCDVELLVEGADLDISGGDTLNEGHPDGALSPGGSKKLGTGGFRLTTVQAPRSQGSRRRRH